MLEARGGTGGLVTGGGERFLGLVEGGSHRRHGRAFVVAPTGAVEHTGLAGDELRGFGGGRVAFIGGGVAFASELEEGVLVVAEAQVAIGRGPSLRGGGEDGGVDRLLVTGEVGSDRPPATGRAGDEHDREPGVEPRRGGFAGVVDSHRCPKSARPYVPTRDIDPCSHPLEASRAALGQMAH